MNLADDAIWEGELRELAVDGEPVVLARIGGCLFAWEGRCLHQRVPLASGRLEGGVLTCPAHLWQYDLRTGRSVNPAGRRLRPCTVRVEGGRVHVGPPGASDGS